MTLARNLRRGGMHATQYTAWRSTSAPASRTTTVYWSAPGSWQTYVYVSENGYHEYSQNKSAPASYVSSWLSEWDVPYSYISYWTTEWHSWAPGNRPYGHNSVAVNIYSDTRETEFKPDFYRNTTFYYTVFTTSFVVDGYYNTDITHTAPRSATVTGSNHYSQWKSATVNYTTYWTSYWSVPYTTHYWNNWTTSGTVNYSSSWTVNYTSTWSVPYITSRQTTW